ncbi:hypothetical protein NPIL_591351 [Nephila pilipes]|uniref:Uncharacterized protein n=1 Tax=Nephila pilipes TaxID=299642 RepID=A0A8X6QQ77_NEPPI|nr:hypothetical protein NPIL_591351 [Nephila pilipes]
MGMDASASAEILLKCRGGWRKGSQSSCEDTVRKDAWALGSQLKDDEDMIVITGEKWFSTDCGAIESFGDGEVYCRGVSSGLVREYGGFVCGKDIEF